MAGLPIRIPRAGKASATSAASARPPQAAGLRTTRPTTAVHIFDRSARVLPLPRKGILPRSAHGPSRSSSAGSAVSDPTTATPTTSIVPIANPVNMSMPVNSSPASEIITVSPDTTMARPDVAAAVRSASWKLTPAARSSRSRRR